ncbi:MAG: hypothetical protein ACRC0G_08810 [Fusobacteriaceae bacterium]
MTLIELMVDDGSVMISPDMISEVEEMGENVKVHMASGNSYVVKGNSFGGMLNTIEDCKYLKVDRTAAEVTEE